jgi:maltooligosyltrehalose trehalohydrolase
LADPKALQAAVALLLLMPQIPMLFMGEEIGSRAPFLFFTDHGPELAKAVREGRRREFAAYADVGHGREIPDPNDPSSFAASEPAQNAPEAASWHGLYAALLKVRGEQITPHLEGARALGAQALNEAAVLARWRLGHGSVLTIAANLGSEPVPADLPQAIPIWGEVSAQLPPHSTLAWLDHG